MYAVIFEAVINQLDQEYQQTAARLRKLAMTDYGCRGFNAASEADREIAISYWDSKDDILAWKNDPEHLHAQAMGKSEWYKSWSVKIVKVEHTSQSR